MEKFYKELQFNLPIYGADITFIHSNDGEQIYEKHKIERPYHHASTYERSVDTETAGISHYKYFIILNTSSELANVGLGCLCHEVYHLSNMICLNYGFIPTFENDEPQAYLLHYLFNKGLEFYFDYTPDNNKD